MSFIPPPPPLPCFSYPPFPFLWALFYSSFLDRSKTGWLRTHDVTGRDLELVILLFLPPESWGYRHLLPHVILGCAWAQGQGFVHGYTSTLQTDLYLQLLPILFFQYPNISLIFECISQIEIKCSHVTGFLLNILMFFINNKIL